MTQCRLLGVNTCVLGWKLLAQASSSTFVMSVVQPTYATKVATTSAATLGLKDLARSQDTSASSMAVGMKVNTTARKIIATLRVPVQQAAASCVSARVCAGSAGAA